MTVREARVWLERNKPQFGELVDRQRLALVSLADSLADMIRRAYTGEKQARELAELDQCDYGALRRRMPAIHAAVRRMKSLARAVR